MRDDFADGRVDPCTWDVAGTVTSTYHEQDGMRVYESEGLLVFEVGPHLETDGDVEIFALPKGAVVEEVSMDLTLLQQEPGSSGSVGLIAYLGDAEGDGGPMVRIDGGPGSNGAGYDFWWCPGYSTDYDDCDHDSPCDDLRLNQLETVSLRLYKTGAGVDSSIGQVPCEVRQTPQDIRSVMLNLDAGNGSGFRIGVDNFYLRIRPS